MVLWVGGAAPWGAATKLGWGVGCLKAVGPSEGTKGMRMGWWGMIWLIGAQWVHVMVGVRQAWTCNGQGGLAEGDDAIERHKGTTSV